ncbi:hypothetical protein [Enterococcus sp. BWR-S5]|uniref:hypothetical protein n=1 Tax=Enterococcus sp. BWR-S5 TaxID=2787714 RepID=UPI003FA5C993
MAKWAGFYLSEHTSEISKEKQLRDHVNLPKERMAPEEINEVLYAAQLKTEMICIQKELRDADGNYFDDVHGFITGYDNLGIYLGDEKVDYDEIRNVSPLPYHKWSDVND